MRTGLLTGWLVITGVCAQRPPPFSVPKVVPQDLQVDGEWWFYSLLDSQFPHDILTPLPVTAVAVADASQGTTKIVSLPPAKYILLEFFAPWCPHCQHFAPEMVKLVSTLQGVQGAGGAPLVAVRTVDCEKLELAGLCDWANANLMPRFVLAPREALLAPLGARASGLAGVKELFPVSSAQETLVWLQQQVPGWPQNAPTPEPIGKNAPFFGWSQPVEGAVEPPEAPAQDLEVAVVSLLHEAFSSLDFTPEKKQALLDLLELLCFAGPGSSGCRQSACQMRAGLQQNWDELTQQKTVTRTAQGDPMPPTTFHYLNWAAVEQNFRWCGRPWPDFARESWSWCRGRTPGTRGYTCGLWLLFHGLLAGAASAREAGQPAPPKAPVQVVRSTVSAFFGCAECRQHFLAVPVSAQDLATPKAQSLWLWSAHNQATARIAQEEQRHSAAAPPREQWPPLAACSQCRAADGATWNTEAVYAHLRAFYGGAYVPDAAPPLLQHGFLGKLLGQYEQQPVPVQIPGAALALKVHIEVYYFTLCPHCQYLLNLGLTPLVEAQLPGSQVQITLLPIYPPLLQWVHDRSQCLAHPDCRTALAPLCALKAVSQPGPADSPALLSGSRFAACAISLTASGQGYNPAAAKGCADYAGIPWDELQRCAEGPESSALLERGAHTLMDAMVRLHEKSGFQDPPSMPWVLLNGDLLSCGDGKTCTATQTPAGDQPLSTPNSLLLLVCSYLSPQLPGCLNAAALIQQAEDRAIQEAGGATAEQAAVKKAQECQDCVEVGEFQWRPAPAVRGGPLLASSVIAAAASCTLVLGRIGWSRLHAGPPEQGAARMLLPAEACTE